MPQDALQDGRNRLKASPPVADAAVTRLSSRRSMCAALVALSFYRRIFSRPPRGARHRYLKPEHEAAHPSPRHIYILRGFAIVFLAALLLLLGRRNRTPVSP